MRTWIITALACVCVLTSSADAQRPRRERGEQRPEQRYTIEQACSDRAQLNTIAFSGLAFITGDFGASTFLPPGKVCDYFGFQYMRDIDAQQKGHNPIFLGRVAGNVLRTLAPEQRQLFLDLATEQAPQFNELAMMRLPLIKAFHRQLANDLPAKSEGLNRDAVVQHVGRIFEFDAQLSLRRAEVYGKLIASLTAEQKACFASMKFGDFSTWPEVSAEDHKLPRGTQKMVNVAYMTYASEFFSWYAGSETADVYFCPERHGTYFGGFYMKDMPAMGKRDYDISTSRTGDSGAAFLDMLTPDQRRHVTSIPNEQRAELREIVDVRTTISRELRKGLRGEPIDRDAVLKLGLRYGELDGAMSFRYAIAFARVGQTLTPEQRAAATRLRDLDGYKSAPAYLYSAAMRELPTLEGVDSLFFPAAVKR
jgi:hypothetical protein